ncbi:MAG: hypothetical protein SH850_10010 [Planctomycetaceae bacterium]|nr:hypothetical protein [Planctomycetaceae bacterium]
MERPPHHRTPTIRFTPTAWAKLLWLRDRGDTEIGGFGITSPEDRLRVEDVVLVPQLTSCVSVAFDDVAVAEFFEDQVDQGRRPEQFARIWMHTHPGDCPLPSPTDEETFARVFGGCDWAVMLILARGGATYARLEWHVGPRGALGLQESHRGGQSAARRSFLLAIREIRQARHVGRRTPTHRPDRAKPLGVRLFEG